MTFYLKTPTEITHDYWEPRPTALKYHFGWDHAGPVDVVAPESVRVHYAVIRQHGESFSPDLKWPDDGTWFPFSRYYEWWAGGIAIALGTSHTYVFLHLDLPWIYRRIDFGEFSWPKIRKPGDYTSYVKLEMNRDPIHVPEGELLCVSGTSGYDDGPHLHTYVMRPGKNLHTYVDPALLWPEIYRDFCPNKHSKGA